MLVTILKREFYCNLVHLLSLIKIRKVYVDIIYALVLIQSKPLNVLTTC